MYCGGSEDEYLRAYMRTSQPDMLYFDLYPVRKCDSSDPDNMFPRLFFTTLARYRKLSLEGNDGTGSPVLLRWAHGPICYARSAGGPLRTTSLAKGQETFHQLIAVG